MQRSKAITTFLGLTLMACAAVIFMDQSGKLSSVPAAANQPAQTVPTQTVPNQPVPDTSAAPIPTAPAPTEPTPTDSSGYGGLK